MFYTCPLMPIALIKEVLVEIKAMPIDDSDI